MSRAHPLLRKWFIIFLAMVIFGIVAAGMTVGALLGYIDRMPNLDELENYNPPEITHVFDRTNRTMIAEYFKERRELVHLRDVPQHVIDAFIAIEDERFYNHFGVDFEAIGRAVKVNIESGDKAQGASTITMQVARNVVFNRKEKKLSRKFRELFTALKIERNYSKDQILEFYINHIYFGNRAYGIQAAAHAYFSKDIKDLTVPEAALIAGLPKAPTALSPTVNPTRARDRRNVVLMNMRKLGYIKNDAEYERYRNSSIELNAPAQRQEPAPYYSDYVRSILTKDSSMEGEFRSRGYSIVSAVDLNLQKICEEELSKGLREVEKKIEEQNEARLGAEAEVDGLRREKVRLMRIREVKDTSIIVEWQGARGEIQLPDKLPYFNPSAVIKPGKLIDIKVQDVSNGKIRGVLGNETHVQGAAVLLDVTTGEILALAGGDDFYDPVNHGQWNRAVQGGRQPGSCWKPLLYGAALDVTDDKGNARFTPGTVIMDEPISFGDWSPKNYEGRFSGPTALYECLVKSRNVPTVKLFVDIGPKKAVLLYHKFNMVHRPSDWDLPAVPPMSLGTPDITPLELTAAYSVFANGGVGITPTPVKRLSGTAAGSDTIIKKPEHVQVLTPQAAYMMARIMQDVITMGTAKATVGKWMEDQKKLGRKLPEIAGKTGTTNGCLVAWFVGYTPNLALGIYVSYDEDKHSLGPKMTGGNTVGPIWAAMMDRILQSRNDWKLKFDVPAGIQFADICSKSGKLVSSGCGASGDNIFTNAAFKEGTAPTGSCDYHGGGYYVANAPQEDIESAYTYGAQTQQPPAQPAPAGYGYGYGYGR